MPKSFKISLALCGVAIIFGLLCGAELYFGEFEFWKNEVPYRYSSLLVFSSLWVASFANAWSLIRCLWIKEPVYAVKNFLFFFFPLGALWFGLLYIGSGV